MSLSQSIESGIESAREKQEVYTPRPEIVAMLSKKVLVMVVGPAVSGKTTIMNEAMKMNSNFSRVNVFTTREARDDDEEHFYYIPKDDEAIGALLTDIENRELVQYAVHPTTGQLYGTRIEDYTSEFNMLAVLSKSVERLRQTGFKDTHTFGLLSEPLVWSARFNSRYPHKSKERTARLEEAALSINWLLQDNATKWLDNENGRPEATARAMMNRSMTPGEHKRAQQLLFTVESMS